MEAAPEGGGRRGRREEGEDQEEDVEGEGNQVNEATNEHQQRFLAKKDGGRTTASISAWDERAPLADGTFMSLDDLPVPVTSSLHQAKALKFQTTGAENVIVQEDVNDHANMAQKQEEVNRDANWQQHHSGNTTVEIGSGIGRLQATEPSTKQSPTVTVSTVSTAAYNSRSRPQSVLLQAPRYIIGQPVQIRMGGKGQWSSAHIVARRGGHRVLVELSTKQQLEVLKDNVRPLSNILHRSSRDNVGSLKSGYLFKTPVSSTKSHSYVSRFFVLQAGQLLYYRDDSSKYPKGKIVLKHGDILKRMSDLKLSIKLNQGFALKSTNLILTTLPIQSEDQRVQSSEPSDHMSRTNGRDIILKADSKELCKEWFDALSGTLVNLKFAASLTSDQLRKYNWHPWISREGNVELTYLEYDPDEILNNSGWCMPLPIAVTNLIDMESASSSKNANNFEGKLWDVATLEGIAAWVVSLTPDNIAWRRKKNRPALSTVKPQLIKLLSRSLVLLVHIGDADTAAVYAEKAVLLAYAHVALATLSFSLSILSDSIQRMHCPPMDRLECRKFSDPAENARRAIEYVKVDNPSKTKPVPVEAIPPELLFYVKVKAYNALANAQKQRGESWKKTEKDAKQMAKQSVKALGTTIRAIPPRLTFPAVITPAPWIVKLCDEQKYLLSKKMVGHHNVCERIGTLNDVSYPHTKNDNKRDNSNKVSWDSAREQDNSESHVEPSLSDGRTNLSALKSENSDKERQQKCDKAVETNTDVRTSMSFAHSEDGIADSSAFGVDDHGNTIQKISISLESQIAQIMADEVDVQSNSNDKSRRCCNMNSLTLPRNYYSKLETLARITNSLIKRPGFGSAFERSNTNVIEEVLGYAAMPISSVEQANLDLIWNVSFLRRLQAETVCIGKEKIDTLSRPTTRESTRVDNGSVESAAHVATQVTDVPVNDDVATNTRIEQKSSRRLSNRFIPQNIDKDIEEGYFFRRHWWGDKRWRKLMELLAQQQVTTPIYRNIKAAVIHVHGEETFDDYKEQISSYIESETFLKDCLERNLQAQRNVQGRRRDLARKRIAFVQNEAHVGVQLSGSSSEIGEKYEQQPHACSHEEKLVNNAIGAEAKKSTHITSNNRPNPPPPPPSPSLSTRSKSYPAHQGDKEATSASSSSLSSSHSLPVEKVDLSVFIDMVDSRSGTEEENCPAPHKDDVECEKKSDALQDNKLKRMECHDSVVDIASPEPSSRSPESNAVSSSSGIRMPKFAIPKLSTRQAQHASATLPPISLREIPLSAMRARFRCYQQCAVNNLCGHVSSLGDLYQEHANRILLALQRASFEVGFERPVKKVGAGTAKLKIGPSRHESLSGLLHSWQQSLKIFADALGRYGDSLREKDMIGNLKLYFEQSQRDFVTITKQWDVFEHNIHRAYRDLNRGLTTLYTKISSERNLRLAAHKKVTGISQISQWWTVASKAKEFERWKTGAHQAYVAFEDVMDLLQDLHFAVAQAVLHKWKTADFLCRIEEHLINMQKKKIGSMIDAERVLLQSRLDQLNRLYDTATSVDAESDLRMMTHTIQLQQQNLERQRQLIEKQEQMALDNTTDSAGNSRHIGADSTNAITRRLIEATGNAEMKKIDHIPAYSSIISSLESRDIVDEISHEAENLIEKFIFEMFEAHHKKSGDIKVNDTHQKKQEKEPSSSPANSDLIELTTKGPGMMEEVFDEASQATMKNLLSFGFEEKLVREAMKQVGSSMAAALNYCTMGGEVDDEAAFEKTKLQKVELSKQRLRRLRRRTIDWHDPVNANVEQGTSIGASQVFNKAGQEILSTNESIHKSIALSQCFNKEQTLSSSTQSTNNSHTVKTQSHELYKISDGDRRLVLYFSKQRIRSQFLRELNNRRQAGNVGPFFDRLKFLVFGLLDACTQNVDVDSIRQVMIMSQTYFRDRQDNFSRVITTTMTNEEINSNREFLCNSELGKHSLWKNEVLWEQMFLLAVSEEVNKLPPPNKARPPAHLLMQSEWDDNPLQQDAVDLFYASKDMYGVDDDYLYRYQQIAFGQLASLVLNMHKFGSPPIMIKQVVTRLAGAFRVQSEQVDILLKDLNRRIDTEHSYNQVQLSSNEAKVQQIVNRLIRGDLATLRTAVKGAIAAENNSQERTADVPDLFDEELTDVQLSKAIATAIRMFH